MLKVGIDATFGAASGVLGAGVSKGVDAVAKLAEGAYDGIAYVCTNVFAQLIEQPLQIAANHLVTRGLGR